VSRPQVLYVERSGAFSRLRQFRNHQLERAAQPQGTHSALVTACLSNRNRALPYYSWKTVAFATAQAVLCGLSLMQVVFVLLAPSQQETPQMQVQPCANRYCCTNRYCWRSIAIGCA